jgi:hypothetical protein
MDTGTFLSDDPELSRASRMRERYLSRTSTILDPRTRRIGVDIAALDAQIAEKRQIAAQEKVRDEAFSHELLEQQRLLLEAAERERQTRRQMAQSVDTFRKAQQRENQSREYDIWRRDFKLLARPAREADSDANLGPSSGQVFLGEDLNKSERLAAQARQRCDWNLNQLQEKEALRRKAETEALQNDLVEIETQKQLIELHNQTELSRVEVRRQLADDNLNMAREKRERMTADKVREQEMNDAHLAMNARSRMVTEEMVPRAASAMDFRGMTIEEQRRVLDEQKTQMEDNEKRRNEAKQREREWEEYQEELRQHGDLAEAKWRREMAQEQKELYQTRLQQAEEFKTRQRYLNRDLYRNNAPEDSYFNQWARESR